MGVSFSMFLSNSSNQDGVDYLGQRCSTVLFLPEIKVSLEKSFMVRCCWHISPLVSGGNWLLLQRTQESIEARCKSKPGTYMWR